MIKTSTLLELKEPKTSMSTFQVPGCLLIRKIAEGGCAEVYEGTDQESNRRVAIKVLSTRQEGNKTEHKRLLKEGALGLRLRHHENIVQTLRVGRTGACPFIVLEFIPGLTLRELLRERKKLNNAELVRLSGALGRALRFIHSSALYHKDLKPDNIMIGEKGLVKVIDFGFAETRQSFSFFGRNLEGSPGYLAPELIRSKKPTMASDLYALGCTLYEAATGRMPFVGSSDAEIISKQLDPVLRPEPFIPGNSDLSIFTQKLILNALEKNTEKRYKSADEFLLELARNPLTNGSEKTIGIPAGWTQK